MQDSYAFKFTNNKQLLLNLVNVLGYKNWI